MKTNKIMCPKCNTKNLRMLDMSEIIGHTCPVKCDNCNLVFGWFELNKYWNIDVGDFYDVVDESIAYVPEPEWENFMVYLETQFGTVSSHPDDWKKWGHSENTEIDYGYPIGSVGSS